MAGTQIIYTNAEFRDMVYSVRVHNKKDENTKYITISVPKRSVEQKKNETKMFGCPLCNTKFKGNIEHLHLYCGNTHIEEMRTIMNKVVTVALEDLNQIAESNDRSDEGQKSKFQGNLERAAKENELEEHLILSSQKVGKKEIKEIKMVKRETNMAIMTEEESKSKYDRGTIRLEDKAYDSQNSNYYTK